MKRHRRKKILVCFLSLYLALILLMPLFELHVQASDKDFYLVVDTSEDRAIDSIASGTLGFVMYQSFKNAGQIRVVEKDGIISFSLPAASGTIMDEYGDHKYTYEIGVMKTGCMLLRRYLENEIPDEDRYTFID